MLFLKEFYIFNLAFLSTP